MIAPNSRIALTSVVVVAVAANSAWHSARHHSAVPNLEIFVVPRLYQGPVIAIYGQSDSAVGKWSSDTVSFQVPKNGILRIGYQEPPHSTKTLIVLADDSARKLRNYPTCADMRVYAIDDTKVEICWLDFSVGGTDIPDHIAAVVTSWARIPENFNRTTFVYDSVLFHGRGTVARKWEEPRAPTRKTPIG